MVRALRLRRAAIEVGAPVPVLAGAWAGQRGTVEARSPEGGLVVELSVFGQKIRAELAAEELQVTPR